MRQAARKDANHDEIAAVFSGYGFDVLDTSGFSGKMLDLLVTLANGFFHYVEIKDGRKPKSARKLTDDERKFIDKRPDQCVIIESVEQARAFCASVIAGRRF
jgi:hypothetical protein